MKTWKLQRYLAIISIPLLIWFVLSLTLLPNYEYKTLIFWLSDGYVYFYLNILLLAVSIHSFIGIDEVFLDYISNDRRLHIAQKGLFAVTLLILVVGIYSLHSIYSLT
jgi:succinate dehydrogenase / fumarate reductase membrane anchor subunit